MVGARRSKKGGVKPPHSKFHEEMNHMKKKPLFCVLGIFFIMVSLVLAQKLPSIDEVIAQYQKAAGGRELLTKPWALSLKGVLESSNTEEEGRLELTANGPKFFMQINNGAVMMGVNETVFWRHAQGAEILKVQRAR